MFVNITDLITLSSLLAISPAVREAAALLAHGDKREIAVLNVRNAQFITLGIPPTWNLCNTDVLYVETIKYHIYSKAIFSNRKNTHIITVCSVRCSGLLSCLLNLSELFACSGKIVIIQLSAMHFLIV